MKDERSKISDCIILEYIDENNSLQLSSLACCKNLAFRDDFVAIDHINKRNRQSIQK